MCLNSSAGNIKQQEWITCNTFKFTHHKVNTNGEPGRLAQSEERLTQEPEVHTYFSFSFRWFKKGSCQLLTKVCSIITGQPLRRSKPAQNSVVRLTDSPDMILVIYRGRKETKQQNYNNTYSERHMTYASDTHTSYQKGQHRRLFYVFR